MPKTKKQPEPRLLIVISGGMLQTVYCDDKKTKALDICIVDYDVDGLDGDERDIADEVKDFGYEGNDPCILRNEEAVYDKKRVEHYFKEKEKYDKRYRQYWKEREEDE